MSVVVTLQSKVIFIVFNSTTVNHTIQIQFSVPILFCIKPVSILLAVVQWSNNEWHMEVSFRLHCEMLFTESLSQTVSVNIQTPCFANMIADIKAGLRSEPHTSGCHPWLKKQQ